MKSETPKPSTESRLLLLRSHWVCMSFAPGPKFYLNIFVLCPLVSQLSVSSPILNLPEQFEVPLAMLLTRSGLSCKHISIQFCLLWCPREKRSMKVTSHSRLKSDWYLSGCSASEFAIVELLDRASAWVARFQVWVVWFLSRASGRVCQVAALDLHSDQ